MDVDVDVAVAGAVAVAVAVVVVAVGFSFPNVHPLLSDMLPESYVVCFRVDSTNHRAHGPHVESGDW